MNSLHFAVLFGYFSCVYSFTKYGRSCQDIGCPSNQECVIQTDPCSYYHRQGECGSYPTCQRKSSSTKSCATYPCPPTKVCRMDGDTPKCVDDSSKVGHIGYDTQSQSHQQGNVYPQLPKGETTPRPYNRQSGTGVNGGYQGSQIGSGYPGRPNNYNSYPQQTGYPQQGYQQQSGYPLPGYNNQQANYPRQTYPQQSAFPQQVYPQQSGYPQQGYYPQQNGYPQQGYYPQGNQRPQGGYPQQQGYRPNSGGQSISDQITNSLKSLGLFCIVLKYTVSRLFSI